MWFSNSYRNDFNSRCILITIFLDSLLKIIIQSIKLRNVNLMKSVFGTKLIDFMMDFIKYPCLIVMDCVILDSLISEFFLQSIDYFYFIKIKDKSSTGSTRNVSDLISLNSVLHLMQFSNDRHFPMKTRFTRLRKKSSSSRINTNVTFIHNVKGI